MIKEGNRIDPQQNRRVGPYLVVWVAESSMNLIKPVRNKLRPLLVVTKANSKIGWFLRSGWKKEKRAMNEVWTQWNTLNVWFG